MKHLLLHFLRLNLREPFSFLYNLAIPLGVFVALLFLGDDPPRSMEEASGLLCGIGAYTIFSSCFFGVGQYIAIWREEGLFITFCKDPRAVLQLILAQGLLRSILTALYFSVILITAAILYREIPAQELWLLIPLSFFLSMGFCALSFTCLLLPLSPSDLSSMLGLLLFLLLFLHTLESGNDDSPLFLFIVNTINPISWSSEALHAVFRFPDSFQTIVRWGAGCMIFGLGTFWGIHRFHRYPILARL